MSAIIQIRHESFQAGAEHTLEAHWKFFLVEGIGLVVLGVAALILPALASIGVALLLGWLLFLAGVLGSVTTFVGRHAPGLLWSLLSSLTAMVSGIVLFLWPAVGALSLTLILTAFLIADGAVTIMFALAHRRALHKRWYWLLVSGVLDLVFAAIIFVALPTSAFVVVGIIIGIDLVFGGTSLLLLTLTAHRTAKAAV